MCKQQSDSFKRKAKKTLKMAFLGFSILAWILCIIPIGFLQSSTSALEDLELTGDDGLLKPFFLRETFIVLELSTIICLIFVAIGIIIFSLEIFRVDVSKAPCFTRNVDLIDEPLIQAFITLYVVITLAAFLLQFALGIYLTNLTPDDGVSKLWNDDTNIAEIRRRSFISQQQCCGWNDIFEYQLSPECNRAELLSGPQTCRVAVENLLLEYVSPVGDSSISSSIFLFFPWVILVLIIVIGGAETHTDDAWSASGS